MYYFLESHTDIKELNTRLMHLESPIRRRVIDRMKGMIDGVVSEFSDMPAEEEVTIPFSGIIMGGNVISSVENFRDSLKIPIFCLKYPGRYFALKVADGSMRTEDIKKNSILLFHVSERVKNGDIGLVHYDDSFLVRKLTNSRNTYILTSCFKASDSMTAKKDKVKICGIFEDVLSFNKKKGTK